MEAGCFCHWWDIDFDAITRFVYLATFRNTTPTSLWISFIGIIQRTFFTNRYYMEWGHGQKCFIWDEIILPYTCISTTFEVYGWVIISQYFKSLKLFEIKRIGWNSLPLLITSISKMYTSVWLSNIIERFQSGAYFFNMGHLEISSYIDIFLLSVDVQSNI